MVFGDLKPGDVFRDKKWGIVMIKTQPDPEDYPFFPYSNGVTFNGEASMSLLEDEVVKLNVSFEEVEK